MVKKVIAAEPAPEQPAARSRRRRSTAPEAPAAAPAPAKRRRGAGAASGANLMDSQLANSVKDSAQQIWLAGMGAFSKAQAEGGKVFETLVKEGLNLQRKTQGLAEDKINEVTGRMTAMAGNVSAKAGQNWDKLEAIFEQRTAKALNKLGVPTAKDVDALVKRVDELATAVARLARGEPASVSPPAAPARKAAVRRVRAISVPAPAPEAAEEPVVEPAAPARKRAVRPRKTIAASPSDAA